MEGPGLGTLKLGAIILTLMGIWGVGVEGQRDRGPERIVMDSHTKPCGGMAGMFGCER